MNYTIKLADRTIIIDPTEHAEIAARLTDPNPDRNLITAFEAYVPLALRELGGRDKREDDGAACWVRLDLPQLDGSRFPCPRAAEGYVTSPADYSMTPACAVCGAVFSSLLAEEGFKFELYPEPAPASTLVFAGFVGGDEYMIRKYGKGHGTDFGVFFNRRYTRRVFGRVADAYSFVSSEGVEIGKSDLESSLSR